MWFVAIRTRRCFRLPRDMRWWTTGVKSPVRDECTAFEAFTLQVVSGAAESLFSCKGRGKSLRRPRVLHLGGLCGPEPGNGVGFPEIWKRPATVPVLV